MSLLKITEKYKTFFVSTGKEIKVDKDVNEDITIISYKIKFIDSVRLMVSSLLNLVDNLVEKNHKIECKDCDCLLECARVVCCAARKVTQQDWWRIQKVNQEHI